MMKKKNIHEIGKFVIETEASALSKLASDLPADFAAAIDAENYLPEEDVGFDLLFIMITAVI